jgi:hypothetical protein
VEDDYSSANLDDFFGKSERSALRRRLPFEAQSPAVAALVWNEHGIEETRSIASLASTGSIR